MAVSFRVAALPGDPPTASPPSGSVPVPPNLPSGAAESFLQFPAHADGTSCLPKEESMESAQTVSAQSTVASDVLHNDNPTRLTPEEIAKALAHHKHRHGGDEARDAKAAAKSAKKKK